MKAILVILILLTGKYVAAQATVNVSHPLKDGATCITQTKLLVYEPVDSLFQKVTKPVISNFIDAIKICGFGYHYDSNFTDKACRLLLPNWLDEHSLSFGNDDFFISFDDDDPASTTCVILHYDLKEMYRTVFHQQFREAGSRAVVTQFNGKKMYTFRNEKGLYTGEIFLDENISIAYYTTEIGKIPQLKTCILSCNLN